MTGSALRLRGLWVSPSHQAWASGSDVSNGQGGEVLRWTGAAWEISLAPTPTDTAAIWGSGDDDIWIGNDAGGLAHFDGASWRADPTVTDSIQALWGTCASDVWAAGTRDEEGNARAWHFDGVRWSSVVFEHNTNVNINLRLTTVTGTGPDDVWFGAAFNHSFHRHPGDLAPVCGNVRIDPGEQCEPPNVGTCDSTCH
jgi:hypothetical protein